MHHPSFYWTLGSLSTFCRLPVFAFALGLLLLLPSGAAPTVVVLVVFFLRLRGSTSCWWTVASGFSSELSIFARAFFFRCSFCCCWSGFPVSCFSFFCIELFLFFLFLSFFRSDFWLFCLALPPFLLGFCFFFLSFHSTRANLTATCSGKHICNAETQT